MDDAAAGPARGLRHRHRRFLDILPLGDVSILGNELFGNNWPIISYFLPTGEEWKPGPLYNCQIKENWAHDNYQGISLVNAENCTVSENLVENNYRFGIALFTVSSGNKVSENTVTGSTEYFGIGLAWSLDNEPVPGPSGNLISENTATGNTQYDLFHGEFSSPNVWRKNVYDTKSGADIP